MDLLTSDEVCKLLKVTKRTLYNYKKLGMISYLKLQRRLRFRKEDVEHFIKNRLNVNHNGDDVLITIKRKIQKALKGS